MVCCIQVVRMCILKLDLWVLKAFIHSRRRKEEERICEYEVLATYIAQVSIRKGTLVDCVSIHL